MPESPDPLNRITEQNILQDENHYGNVYKLNKTVLVILTDGYGDSAKKKARILRNEKLRFDLVKLRDEDNETSPEDYMNKIIDMTEDLTI